eukprot:TRINITY_DN3502_c0_g1_i1.p1 TRINITY_DN3502_c0_g1~~TRINITY_DN3502_c0_g1_i1.p1  ORF type:complete len:613 (+),score=102.22 TRINITY_DN3502_c0_g1_i1:1755-3593(+)
MVIIFSSISPKNFNEEVVEAIKELIEEPMISNVISYEMIQKILLNPDIWIYTPYEVQRFLWENIIPSYYQTYPSLRTDFRVRMLLDLISLYYYQVLGENSLYLSNVTHPITNNIIGERPSPQQLSDIRKLIISLIKNIIIDTGTSEESLSVLEFISSVDIGPAPISEILEIVQDILLKNHESTFCETLYKCGGYNFILQIFQKYQDDSVRIEAMRIINILFNLNSSANMFQYFVPLYEMMKGCEFSKDLYDAIISLICGILIKEFSVDQFDDRIFVYPELFYPLSLLLKNSQHSLAFFRDVRFLINLSRYNMNAVLDQKEWVHWFPIVYSLSPENQKGEILPLLVEIYSLLIVESFQNQKKAGHLTLSRAISGIHFGVSSSLYSEEISKEIIGMIIEGVIGKIIANLDQWEALINDESSIKNSTKKVGYASQSFIQLVCETEEYIYFSNGRCNINTNPSHIDLVEKLFILIDTLGLSKFKYSSPTKRTLKEIILQLNLYIFPFLDQAPSIGRIMSYFPVKNFMETHLHIIEETLVSVRNSTNPILLEDPVCDYIKKILALNKKKFKFKKELSPEQTKDMESYIETLVSSPNQNFMEVLMSDRLIVLLNKLEK